MSPVRHCHSCAGNGPATSFRSRRLAEESAAPAAAYQAAKWAVGGFSEVLAKEVRDFGIQVTIVEPGSMRTRWAGSSMTILPVSDAYKPIIEPVAARLRRIDGMQPGDPARIARALLGIAGSPTAPLRLLMGSDAVAVAGAAARFRAEEDAQWRELSESVSFPPARPE